MDDDNSNQNTGTGAPDDDVSLPKATISKLITDLLPYNLLTRRADISIGKETKDILSECCVGNYYRNSEFIHLYTSCNNRVSSEANDVCDKDKKKTIGGDQVLQALRNLGFEKYIPELEALIQEHKSVSQDRITKKFIKQDSGMTEEEKIKSQEALFAKARERMALQLQQQEQSQGEAKAEIKAESSENK
jgi:down-regulator of transcription 1